MLRIALGLRHGSHTSQFEPDASLAFEPKNPFLVLEVAITQDAKSVKRKARHYITGSRGKIAYVVVITVRRMKNQMVEQGGGQSNKDGTLESKDDLRNEASDTTRTDIPGDANQHGNDGQREETESMTSTLTDPPSDLSQWDVFPPQSPSEDQASPRSTGLGNATTSSVSIPPLLYRVLDTNDVLNTNDSVYASVFKSVSISSPTVDSTQQVRRVMQPLIEEVEVYPRPTAASFSISWSDIAKSAPRGAGESVHINLEPLSRLAQVMAGHVEGSDDGFSALSS